MHYNFKAAAARRCGSRCGMFRTIMYCASAQLNCYFRASDQNSAITIRFSDPDFIKKGAIIWRSDDVITL